MSKSEYLIVFIDGFPFAFLDKTDYLKRGFLIHVPLIPGIGYSINIHAEIFMGARPDDIGYLNEWICASCCSRTHWLTLLGSLFNAQGRIPINIIDQLAHKFLGRLHLAKANIPFLYQRFFVRKRALTLSSGKAFIEKSVLSHIPNIEFCISETIKRRAGTRDQLSFARAMDALKRGKSVFVTFADLDNISHKYGVGSEEHMNRILQLDRWIKELSNVFIHKGGQEDNILVFSDHGMVNVRQGIRCAPESWLGSPGPDSYLYFLDSTMMRLWVIDKSLQRKAEDFLNSLGCGRLLSSDERRRFGVSSLEFGDYIYLLNEGEVFDPCFISYGRLPAAMHGYYPMLDSQRGIFLTNSRMVNPNRELRSIDLFDIFKKIGAGYG